MGKRGARSLPYAYVTTRPLLSESRHHADAQNTLMVAKQKKQADAKRLREIGVLCRSTT
jgi:hypothetical protein